MGIERFSQYFQTKVVNHVDRSAQIIVIDGNLYWERTISHSSELLSESEFYTHFFRTLLSTLLAKHITKSTSQLKRVEIVFDNEQSRNFLKWWKCIQRAEAMSRKVRTFFCDQAKIQFFWFDYLDTYYTADFEPDIYLDLETIKQVVAIVGAKCDTDDYVFSGQAFKHETEPGKHTIIRINSPDCYDGDLVCISPLVIFTGDSDFLSRFPYASEVAVMDYEDVR